MGLPDDGAGMKYKLHLGRHYNDDTRATWGIMACQRGSNYWGIVKIGVTDDPQIVKPLLKILGDDPEERVFEMEMDDDSMGRYPGFAMFFWELMAD